MSIKKTYKQNSNKPNIETIVVTRKGGKQETFVYRYNKGHHPDWVIARMKREKARLQAS